MRLIVVALLAACLAPRVQEFVDARTVALCARHARCGTLADNGWESADDCESALSDAAAARAASGLDGCPGFDANAADDCLSALDDAACDAPADLSACDTVCAATDP